MTDPTKPRLGLQMALVARSEQRMILAPQIRPTVDEEELRQRTMLPTRSGKSPMGKRAPKA